MKNIKILSICLGLAILLCHSSCTEKKTEDTTTIHEDSLPVTVAVVPVIGTWTIKNFYLGDISALDEKMAKEWLDKKLVIDEKLHFDFSQMKSFQTDFNGLEDCALLNVDSPEVVPASEYFDPGRSLYTDLKLDSTSVKIYRTGCQDHPFSEFILTDRNELISTWEGAFFIMTKDISL